MSPYARADARRRAAVIVWSLSLVGLSLAAVAPAAWAAPAGGAAPGDPAPVGVGHRQLRAERHTLRALPGRVRARPTSSPGVRRPMAAEGQPELFGFLPYWETPYTPPRWDLLTTLAWFSVDVDAGGEAVDLNGWGGQTTADLAAEAAAEGVRFLVSITNFSNSDIGQLVSSPDARATCVETVLSLMATHAADGVNVDFELVPAAQRADFVTFLEELDAALDGVGPGGADGHLSVDVPAIDWSDAYDGVGIAAAVDVVFVMAYGFHWKAGDPGPISPLYGGGGWGPYAVAPAIGTWMDAVGADHVGKLVVGLPTYGRAWPVASTAIPGTALANGVAVTYDVAHPEATALGRQWDATTSTPYYHRGRAGALEQVWYDDAESLAIKAGWVVEQPEGLGGVGLWALGYDGGDEALWGALESALWPEAGPGPEPTPEPGPEASVEPGPEAAAEPGPEPAAEPLPDVAEAGGAMGGEGVMPDRRSGRRGATTRVEVVKTLDEGCGGGRSAGHSLAWVAVLVLAALWVRRRREPLTLV